jgi:hypothetical protein
MALFRSYRIVSTLRRRFGVAAPRLSVRTQWSWKIKATIVAIAAAVLGGLFYSGFDAGRIFAGFNVGKVEEERKTMTEELITLRAENARLRKEQIELANAAQMAVGSKDVMTKQIVTLQQENTQLKEETSFFEKLIGTKAGGKNGLAVQRLQAERETLDSYRFRALVVQGSAETAFKGKLSVTATLDANNKRVVINLPEEQPDTAPALNLDFKAFQRIEGSFKVPANAQLKSLQVRVFQAGNKEAKAQQALTL